MTKIRPFVGIAWETKDGEESAPADKIVDVPPVVAKELIGRGKAEAVKSAKRTEEE